MEMSAVFVSVSMMPSVLGAGGLLPPGLGLPGPTAKRRQVYKIHLLRLSVAVSTHIMACTMHLLYGLQLAVAA